MKIHVKIGSIALLVSSIGTSSVAQTSGETIYKDKCQMCHGADGEAQTGMGKLWKISPLKSPALLKASDSSLIAATKNGAGKMPAYSGKLTDAQIQDVIAYVRTLQKQ